MFKPVRDEYEREQRRQRRRERRRRRRLKTVATFPTLLTLGSVCFGFAALYCCALELQALGADEGAGAVKTLGRDFVEHKASTYLAVAVWMVVAGMLCDALDGRVARMTRSMSRFGEQLDSLADAITFGVAPALMVVTLVRRELAEWDYMPWGYENFPRLVWIAATLFVCCAVLRLARFSVETSTEEADHSGFRGLPSPGGAGGIISLIYLHEQYKTSDWLPGLTEAIAVSMPVITIVLAVLMVSRIPYRHAATAFFRRRPFQHLAPLIMGVAAFYLFTELAGILVSWGFILSGPVRYTVARFRGGPVAPLPADEQWTDESQDRPGEEERKTRKA